MLHHSDSTKKQFIGRKLASVARESDSSFRLSFQDGTSSTVGVYGDCCSTSIFYDFILPVGLAGSEILDIQEMVEAQDSQEEAQRRVQSLFPDFYLECLSVWDVVIKTSAGDVRLLHINSSNGYYDGCTSWTNPELTA